MAVKKGDEDMKDSTKEIFEELFTRYPALEACRADVECAYGVICGAYRAGGKLLVCGNGGSASDAEHIVGELLKKFKRHRDIPSGVKAALEAQGDEGAALAEKLEGALPAVSLISQSAILTAFANDVGWEPAFAQQVLGLGRPGDVLAAISTSGNSRNCVAAARVARACGLKVVSLTGAGGGRLAELSDAAVRVPASETYQVQEYHLPVYHALCAMLEEELF